MNRLLSIQEVAQRLACSEALLRAWMYQGKLPYVKVGRQTCMRKSEIEGMLGLAHTDKKKVQP